jgi:hypothetical protein
MVKAIYFDMDGTFVDLYGVNGWLENLQAFKTRPYREAKPLLNMRKFGKVLNQLQKNGYHIGIISWGSKAKNPEYDAKVAKTKKAWLEKHLGSVQFDEINVVPYGTPKEKSVKFPFGILFDDEKPNRDNWAGTAYDVNKILEILETLN